MNIWWWLFEDEGEDGGAVVALLPNQFCATVRAVTSVRDVVAQQPHRDVGASLAMRTVEAVC